VSVAEVKFAALAVMTAEPPVTPVTVNVAVVEPAAMVTLGVETVATAVLAEATANVKPPAGAGPESVRVSV
jgi:hypothetical protein